MDSRFVMFLNRNCYCAVVILMVTTLVPAVVLSSHPASAETATASASVTVASACTLTSTVNTPHTATIIPGTYTSEIGITNFNVICNDASGYSIYAVGYSNGEYGNTNLIHTDTAIVSGNTIVTGIGTNDTETSGVSNWAMKLTPVTGTYAPTIESAPNTSGGTSASFSSYHTVPSTYTKVATYPSLTDTSTGSSLTSTYAAYITGTQTIGTYAGKVKYTMVHPASETPLQPHDATVGCISYWPNASGVIDNMGDQCNLGNNVDVNLWPTNFNRPGYGFAGWSDQFDYDLNSSTNTGHIYGPMETITTPSNMTTKGLSLYAIWVLSAGNLQNWQGCSAVDPGEVTALTDQRDNNTYAVAKLADGKCWMIENLRLADKTPNNVAIELNSTNTNSPSLPLTNTWWFTADNDSDNKPTSNSLSTPVSPSSSMPWCTYPNANCYDQSMLSTDNTTDAAVNMTSPLNDNVYSYGNYYNWYSATAGNGTYSTNQNNTSVAGDLCPTGWRLPMGGDKSNEANNEFWSLVVVGLNNGTKPANYNTSTSPYYSGVAEASPVTSVLRSYPNNFLYSGAVNSGSFVNKSSGGSYWSSTAKNDYYGYYLGLLNFNMYPGTINYYKYNGQSVRCVTGS